MKRLLHTLVFAVTLTSASTFAAEQQSREEARARWEEISQQLELTDEQKAQIAPIVHEQMIELKALRDNTALKPRYKLKRAQAINETASTQIRALLTPEQQVKYDALREENKAKMREQFQQRMKARQNGGTAPQN